jgi:L-fuconolactonase
LGGIYKNDNTKTTLDMRIDSHQHYWQYHPVRNSWIDENMKVLRRDFLPENLKPILDRNNIQGSVAVQAGQTEDETNFLLDLADHNDFIKGVVGWIDLRANNIEERLQAFSGYKKLVGMRHIVQSEPVEFMLGKEFQNGISKLKKFGLTYDILVFPTQLKSAVALVEKFPEQDFVLDHIAKPYIKDGKIDQWAKDMHDLAQFPNVECKVSGMVTEADMEQWNKDDFTKYLDVIFNLFGSDRIMYGSDWPVCLLAAQYEEQLEIAENYISGLTPEERAKIMGENAIRFYELKG